MEKINKQINKNQLTKNERNETRLITRSIAIETFQVKSSRVWHLMSGTGTKIRSKFPPLNHVTPSD